MNNTLSTDIIDKAFDLSQKENWNWTKKAKQSENALETHGKVLSA